VITDLQINAQRLWDSLMETAKIGATPKGGISRLTLTDLDRQVRDWFKGECEKLGCRVTVDEVGNMFAVRAGNRADVLPIAMGSHLDTQPTGGKFDGVLGVLGGLEVLRTLHETGSETTAPIMLVNWTNEEGSRFPPAMLGSGVYAGVFDRVYADSREDRQGVTFGEAIEAIGYRGEARAGSVKFGAMFELHIEQGPILERDEKLIGIVQGVQGMRWYDVSLTGREAHTGSTPMVLRRDALVGAARLIDRVENIALEYPPSAVGTVALVEVKPNSRNVIPGQVFFTVDFRHPEDAVLEEMEQKTRGRRQEDLGVTRREVRCRLHRGRAACRREGGLLDAGHGVGRRA
jgi:N-carbamoyl-L-amino-acid hydrolase